MKKRIIALLVAVLLLAGCGNKDLARIEITYAPSTGETLSYEIEDESIVGILNEQSREENPGVDGGAITNIYEFTGKKAGKTTVTFTNDRFGTKSETVYELTVDDNLKVTYKQK